MIKPESTIDITKYSPSDLVLSSQNARYIDYVLKEKYIYRQHLQSYAWNQGNTNIAYYVNRVTSEDSIQEFLQHGTQAKKLWRVLNKLNGKYMLLYNGRGTFNSKGAAILSLTRYMSGHFNEFTKKHAEDMLRCGLIEVVELDECQ